MIVEIVTALLLVGGLGYVVYWKREQTKWVRIHEKQVTTLKWLKKEIWTGK